MKSKLIALLILAFGFSVFAQDINKMDANGKRHGLWKGTYESGKPRYEGTFDHGKETGTFKFFEDSKASTLMATRVFNKDGSCYTTFFEPTGTKVSEGKEVNHKQEGLWKYYHYKSTAIMSTENYKDGKLNGMRKVFFPDGKIAEEVNYLDGLKEGPYKKYTEKGVVVEESIFKKDEYQGPAIFRDAHGNIASEGVFKDNKKVGIWKFYDKGKVKEKNMDLAARDALLKAQKKN